MENRRKTPNTLEKKKGEEISVRRQKFWRKTDVNLQKNRYDYCTVVGVFSVITKEMIDKKMVGRKLGNNNFFSSLHTTNFLFFCFFLVLHIT